MKNIYFSLLFTLIFTLSISQPSVFAQQVQKTVVAELFTNTRCGICANRVPGFKSQLQDYGDQVLLLSFYSAAPYPSCVLHQEAKVVNDSRVSNYNVSGSPLLYLNGERAPTSVWTNPQAAIDAFTGQTTTFEITSSLTTDGNLYSVAIELIQHETFEPYQETVLQVFVIEKNVTAGNLANYMEHTNVVRAQLTPASGLVYQPTAGMNQLFTYDFEIQPFWDESEIAVIAFLQGADSEIYNASMAEPTISNISQFEKRPVYRIFPNPAADYLYIQSENRLTKTIGIYNLLGALVFTDSFNEREKKVLLSEFPRGLYLLRISSEGIPDRTVRLLIER